MKQPLLLRLRVLSFLLLGICTIALAQTPSPVLDSIGEDSYQDVLEQQEQAVKKAKEYPIFVAPNYPGIGAVYAVDQVPSPRGIGIMGYFSDPEDYVSADEEERINRLLYDLEQESSVETAVVILPSIWKETPKNFATKLFEKWGIGKSDTDNGLLILVVMDQRRTEFEVGYGLEPILTDLICYRIGTNEIVPHFKAGAYGQGIESAVLRIKEFIENPEVIDEVYGYTIDYNESEEAPFRWQWYHVFLMLYGLSCSILGIWYYAQAFAIQLSKDDYYDKYHRLYTLKFGCIQYLFPLPMFFFAKMAESRLEKYRAAPRFSKKNGLPMTLLTNYDEIDFLEEVQLLEEELKSILYDVWITEDHSDIMILEYEGPNGRKYSNCKKCGYKTFGKKYSLVLVKATYDRGGTRIDRFECRNCNYLEEKEVETPRKSRPSDSSSSGSSFSSSSSSSSSSSCSFGGGSSGGGGAGVSW